MKRSVLVLCLAAGCTATDPTPGNQALGITEFEVTTTSTEVKIVGLNAKRDHLAEASLTLGRVILADEGLDGPGRTLNVKVLGKEADHSSVGVAPVTLPHLADPDIVAFLSDPHVAMPLAAWGVSFAATNTRATHSGAGEQPFVYCNYAVNGACGMTSCEEYVSGGQTYEYVCCNSNGDGAGNKALVNRSCSTPYGTSSCGTNGPGGCAPCWNQRYYSDCETGWLYDDTNWVSYDLDFQGPNWFNEWECNAYGGSDCHLDGNGAGDGGWCYGICY